MKALCFVLFFFFICFAGEHYPKLIFQKSSLNPSDSIVLSFQQDNILPMYSKINIYRDGKEIFNLEDDKLEVRGYQYVIFAEYFTKRTYTDYIFKYDDRPKPDKYLVIRTSKDTTFLLGITPNNTATIFGDVDLDGFFEIGGQKEWLENNEKPDIFVFRIDTGFPKAQIFTDCMNAAINGGISKNKENKKLNNTNKK